MKKIKIITAVLCFFILCIACGKLFNYLLVDDTKSYTRIMMHEMYEQENIDILFVGSSHCYRSLNPEITDEVFDANTFNAGSSSQAMDASYALIKEAARNNDIQHIYLEVFFDIARQGRYKDRTELVSTYIVSDYMKPSWNKLNFMLNATSKEYYINSFIISRREWEKFFDSDYVMNLVQTKQTEDYKNYQYPYTEEMEEFYVEKGYVQSRKIVREDLAYLASIDVWNSINESDVSEDWLDSLKDIISFCEKEKIGLTLISAPMTDILLQSIGNYDAWIVYVNQLLEGTNVKYYDFNLCKDDYFQGTTAYFKDEHHLNGEGANAFSEVFAKFFTGQITEEELFYNSYNEKVANFEPRMLGLVYSKNEDENIKEMKIIATREEGLEYKIVLYPNEGERYVVQDFSANTNFIVPLEEGGICSIEVREVENTAKVIQSLEIEY